MSNADFLVEVHTEELPPKSLQLLANSFLATIESQLAKLELPFKQAYVFVTPRRLAVYVKKLAAKQADTVIEKKGPAVTAAFDTAGSPTPACIGFARSCGVTPEQLITIQSGQASWVGYMQSVAGKSATEILPVIVQNALNALPIPKRMRWGASSVEFVRPVHSVIMLYGKDIIEGNLMGCPIGRQTRGHRFLSKGVLSISSPARYESSLMKKYVMVDFAKRKKIILDEAKKIAQRMIGDFARVNVSDVLLDEVTGLVEWPVAVCGKFDDAFLSVPQEALISAMQDHQRYFPVTDEKGKLLPYFITISNIVSHDVNHVIAGNERVLRARLSDANFFFTTDKKQKLSDRVERLKQIVYQAKLGSLYDKTQRVSALAKHIAQQLKVNVSDAERAGYLSKADLTTDMVGEFPELQGVMGYHYAKQDGESDAVAMALQEQYLPRFSGDGLPGSLLGSILAIADRIDTLVGVFGINQAPTGDKDPFGLRRAALGVLRILIEKELDLDLQELIQFAIHQYGEKLENQATATQCATFILERLRPWYQEKNISADVLASVAALGLTKPYDIHLRIQAVQSFRRLPEAESLCVANKRVSNILAKCNGEITAKEIQKHLFEHEVEGQLARMLVEKHAAVVALSQSGDYTEILQQLASLRETVDQYFDKVLVMAEDKSQRENRLLMLKELRQLFLYVADIALLQ